MTMSRGNKQILFNDCLLKLETINCLLVNGKFFVKILDQNPILLKKLPEESKTDMTR